MTWPGPDRQSVRGIDGVSVVEACSVRADGLQVSCQIRALAPGRDELEAGVRAAFDLLAHLGRIWGPGGELDRATEAAIGATVELSWDTVLLLGQPEQIGIELDVAHHLGTKTGVFQGPDLATRHAFAARLLLAELMECGCLLAEVDLGDTQCASNRGIRSDIRWPAVVDV